MKYLFLLFSLFAFVKPAHDVPIATFDITLIDDFHITMNMEFDRQDLESVLTTFTDENIEQYISTHTQWKLNQEITSLEICSIQKDHDHYYLQAQFPSLNQKLKTLDIHNSCLVHIPDHSNVIYLHYQGKKRGFRLHKDRLQTSINL